MFSVVILFHYWFPLLEKVEIRAFILPRNFPAVLIIFTGRVGAPPPRGAGRPSLICNTILVVNFDPNPINPHDDTISLQPLHL